MILRCHRREQQSFLLKRVVADVTAGEDEFGIWIAGAVAPETTADQVGRLRSAEVQGEWRHINGGLELISLRAVGGLLADLRSLLAASIGRTPVQRAREALYEEVHGHKPPHRSQPITTRRGPPDRKQPPRRPPRRRASTLTAGGTTPSLLDGDRSFVATWVLRDGRWIEVEHRQLESEER